MQMTDKIFEKMNQGKFKPNTARFGSTTEEEKEEILQQCGAKNSNRSLKTALNCIMEYLIKKELPHLCDITQWWIYIQKFLAHAPPQQDKILSFLHVFTEKHLCQRLASPPMRVGAPPTGNPASAPVMDEQLPKILSDFYVNMRTKKNQGSHSSWKNGDSFSSLEKSWNFVIFAKYPGKMRQTLEFEDF